VNTGPRIVACSFHPRPRRRASRPPRQPDGVGPPPPVPLGRVPRVARLLALALRFEQLVQTGVIANYAQLARLGHVSRARVSQILSLRFLAPDLQEVVLFLPPTVRGHDPIYLRQLQRVVAELDWKHQRRLWHALQESRRPQRSCDAGDAAVQP
jgi:hypothetical protein